MKRKSLFVMMAAGFLATANADDEKKADPAAAAAEEMLKKKDLQKLFKNQLVKIEDGEAKPAELEEGVEYYLVYHSASW